MRSISLAVLTLIGATCIAVLSYRLGVNEAVARGAYVQSIPIREEAKCLAAKDAECMRTHWRMRASFVAESARRSLSHTVPTSVNSELEAYLTWAKAQQGIQVVGGPQ